MTDYNITWGVDLGCRGESCWCQKKNEEVVVKPPPQSFEQRVVALALVLHENQPRLYATTPVENYTWSNALADATDIILAADLNIDGECTCD